MWSQQGLTVEELAEVWLWMTAHVPLRPTEKGAAIGTAQELQSSDVLTRTASIRLDQDPRFLKAWERHGRSSLLRSDLFNDRLPNVDHSDDEQHRYGHYGKDEPRTLNAGAAHVLGVRGAFPVTRIRFE